MKHPLYFGALLTQKIIDNFFIYKKEQRREDAINKAIAAKEAEAYHAEDQTESETA